MKLEAPTIEYENSFIEAVGEYQAVDSQDRRDIYDLSVDELKNDFPSYVSKLLSESKGENLPEGYVPQTTYWLIDKNEFIGRVSIRHQLTPHLLLEGGHIGYDIRPTMRNKGYGKKILELALAKAKELSLEKVLITCNETNIGSKKIIEANGGILENKQPSQDGNHIKLRYWISV